MTKIRLSSENVPGWTKELPIKTNLSVKKHTKSFADLETLKENMMHSNIQTTDSLYCLFDKKEIKERIHSLSNSEEINLLEEIPPQDRQFVLSLYRVYNQKHSD